VECGCEVLHGQGDGEEVEGVPGPAEESDLGEEVKTWGFEGEERETYEEEHPLATVEGGEELEWVWGSVKSRLQGCDSCHAILADFPHTWRALSECESR
jgi:hypothetical protein